MISGVVFTALRSLVADKCYPSAFPQEPLPTWPAIRYTIVSEAPIEDLCGTDTVETDDVSVQVDAVARTYGAMIALRDQVITAMMALDPPAVRVGGFETYDEETKTHRAILDYVFYPSSPTP
jgi:hypothetical protein